MGEMSWDICVCMSVGLATRWFYNCRTGWQQIGIKRIFEYSKDASGFLVILSTCGPGFPCCPAGPISPCGPFKQASKLILETSSVIKVKGNNMKKIKSLLGSFQLDITAWPGFPLTPGARLYLGCPKNRNQWYIKKKKIINVYCFPNGSDFDLPVGQVFPVAPSAQQDPAHPGCTTSVYLRILWQDARNTALKIWSHSNVKRDNVAFISSCICRCIFVCFFFAFFFF